VNLENIKENLETIKENLETIKENPETIKENLETIKETLEMANLIVGIITDPLEDIEAEEASVEAEGRDHLDFRMKAMVMGMGLG